MTSFFFKKRLLLVGVMMVVASIFFTGCQSNANLQQNSANSPNGVVEPTAMMEERTGIISSLGSTFTNEATQLLQMDDGTTMLLKSSTIDLNRPDYLHQHVQVSGPIDTSGEKAVMDVQKIDILATAQTEPTSAISWQAYSNSKLGFQIRYRNDFQVQDDGTSSQVVFFRPIQTTSSSTSVAAPADQNAQNQTSTSSSISSNALATSTSTQPLGHSITFTLLPAKTSDQFLKLLGLQSLQASEVAAGGYTQSKIANGTLDAFKKNTGSAQNIVYEVDAKSRYYEISFQGGGDPQSLEDQNVFYEMLNAFAVTSDTVSIPSTMPPSKISSSPTSPKNSPIPVTPPVQKPSPSSTQPAPLPASPVPAQNPPSPTTGDSAGSPSAPTDQTSVLPGYALFLSNGFHFQIAYPKNWFFSMGESQDTNVFRHYDFGPKDDEQQVGLDLYTGKIPSGSTSSVDGKTITKVSQGASVEIYVQGVGKSVYRLTGPSSENSTLLNMANSLSELKAQP